MSNFKKTVWVFGFSTLVWIVPFIVSIPFFNSSGSLAVNFWLFKLIMVVVLSLVTFFGYKFLNKMLIQNTFWLSILTVLINTLLDVFILIPVAKYSFLDYILQILSIYVIFIPTSIYFSKKQLKN